MTPALARYDGHAAPGWTGFVLLIVPMEGTDTTTPELVRLVSDRIRTDVVLADAVRVAGGPAVDGADPEQAYAVANALVRTALAGPRRLFAPRAVFGYVLVGRDAHEAERLAGDLAQTEDLRRLPVHSFGIGDTGLAETAAEVTDRLRTMVDSYERWPDFVLDERQFRALLRPPSPTGASAPQPSQQHETAPQPARQETIPRPAPDETVSRPPQREPVVPQTPAVGEPNRRSPQRDPAVRPSTTRRAGLQLPHASVLWGWRDMLRSRRRRPPTQDEALQRLADDGYAVNLVYFVLVAENEPINRSLQQRRLQLLLDLDNTYARLEAEPANRDAPVVEVALFTAGRSLVRHGPLRPAGQLARTRPPKVGVDYLDLVECLGAVHDAYRWERTSLNRRGIDVPQASVIFISSSAPLADIESVDRFHALCAECQVAWILLGADAGPMSEEFTDAGALVVSHHPDIVAELVERGFVGVFDGFGSRRPPASRHDG